MRANGILTPQGARSGVWQIELTSCRALGSFPSTLTSIQSLAARTDEDKIINAVQKTWKKMTPAAREHALRLPYGPNEKALLDRALAETH